MNKNFNSKVLVAQLVERMTVTSYFVNSRNHDVVGSSPAEDVLLKNFQDENLGSMSKFHLHYLMNEVNVVSK